MQYFINTSIASTVNKIKVRGSGWGLGLLRYIPSMGITRILKFRILVMYPFRSSETVGFKRLFFPHVIDIYELRRAIFSSFYNISLQNFAIYEFYRNLKILFLVSCW